MVVFLFHVGGWPLWDAAAHRCRIVLVGSGLVRRLRWVLGCEHAGVAILVAATDTRQAAAWWPAMCAAVSPLMGRCAGFGLRIVGGGK